MLFQKGNKINKGRTPWNKNSKGVMKAWNKGIKLTTEQKKKMNLSGLEKGHGWNRGKKASIEDTIGMSKRTKGLWKNPKYKKHMSEVHLGQKAWNKGMKGYNSGENSHFWKGGITPENSILRKSLEYKLWRTAVFERDGYTCIWCGQIGGELQADHIQRWGERPDLRFAIDNGRTLCKTCHHKRHRKLLVEKLL